MRSIWKLFVLSVFPFIGIFCMALYGDAAVSGLEGIDGVTFSPPPVTTSYHWTDTNDWTRWNKFWFAGAVVGQGADVMSTAHQLNQGGCHEANPLFGKDPSTGLLLLGKVIGIGAAYLFTEWYMDGMGEDQQLARNYAYGLLTITGVGLGAYNMSIDCSN